MRHPLLTLVASFAVASIPAAQTSAESDPATEAAIQHFAEQNTTPAAMPGSEQSILPKGNDPASSPDAMVAYFTEEMPEDVTVAARRRHVDLDIKFAFDSAELSEGGIAQLDTAGQALNDPALESHRFMLGGHTDDRGDAAYNRSLSKRRAESAKRYLVENYGISPERLETAGFGSDHPKDAAPTTEARKRNRRVVLELVD